MIQYFSLSPLAGLRSNFLSIRSDVWYNSADESVEMQEVINSGGVMKCDESHQNAYVCRHVCCHPTELLSLAVWPQWIKLISIQTQISSDCYFFCLSLVLKRCENCATSILFRVLRGWWKDIGSSVGKLAVFAYIYMYVFQCISFGTFLLC